MTSVKPCCGAQDREDVALGGANLTDSLSGVREYNPYIITLMYSHIPTKDQEVIPTRYSEVIPTRYSGVQQG